MNTKLVDLVRQAGLRFDMKVNDDNEDVECIEGVCGAYPTSAQIDKLAELIIKDVMQIAANKIAENAYQELAVAVIEHYREE